MKRKRIFMMTNILFVLIVVIRMKQMEKIQLFMQKEITIFNVVIAEVNSK
jgi:hypothetical protein